MKIQLLTLLLIAYSPYYTFGQSIGRSSINSFGNSVEVGNLHLSQSVGQSSATNRFEQTNLLLRQGFQQVDLSYGSQTKGDIIFRLYPNPNQGRFQIDFGKSNYGEISYQLLDINGRVVDANKLLRPTIYEFNYALTPGVYTLMLTNEVGMKGYAKIIIIA